MVIDTRSLILDEAATKKLREKRPEQRFEAVINEGTLDIELEPYGEQVEETTPPAPT